jgi:chromosome segregation ATPase
MSEDRTGDPPNKRSFEERIFARFGAFEARFESRFSAVDARFDAVDARFDAIDGRLDAIDGRLDGLDTRVQALEARSLDTKPIWERALAEILNIKERVENIERKFDVLIQDMMQLRSDQRRLEAQFDALKSKLA